MMGARRSLYSLSQYNCASRETMHVLASFGADCSGKPIGICDADRASYSEV